MNPAIGFFHPNVCNVCKVTCRVVELKRCSQCRLIAYCSVKHQKRDWKHHKAICKVLVKVMGMTELTEFRKKRVNQHFNYRLFVLKLCELYLGRTLDAVEMNMLYFQKVCSFCDANENLTDCPACLSSSVCDSHRDKMDEHNDDCRQLKLCLEAHLFKSKDYLYPSYQICEDLDTKYIDMDSFITKKLCITSGSNSLSKAMVSDQVTRPLTVLYALSVLNYPIEDSLSIHIIGSDCEDISTAEHWNLLRKVRPIKNLRLTFIGPEIKSPCPRSSEGISISTSRKLYHDFVGKDAPDMIVAFNCGIHEFVNEKDDTWGPSLGAIVARRVPVVLTSYTASEAILDVTRLVALDDGLRVRQMSNPFASLSPLRDVESLGVYFINNIVSVLTPS